MLKLLRDSIRFISNNVMVIQSFEKRIKAFEYLNKAIASQETHSTMHDEKNRMTILRENPFSHTVKAILAE